MRFELRADQSVNAELVAKLTALQVKSSATLPSAGMSHQFAMWADEMAAQLENHFTRTTVQGLMVTPRSLAIHSMQPPAVANIAIRAEQDHLTYHLGKIIAELQASTVKGQQDLPVGGQWICPSVAIRIAH